MLCRAEILVPDGEFLIGKYFREQISSASTEISSGDFSRSDNEVYVAIVKKTNALRAEILRRKYFPKKRFPSEAQIRFPAKSSIFLYEQSE